MVTGIYIIIISIYLIIIYISYLVTLIYIIYLICARGGSTIHDPITYVPHYIYIHGLRKRCNQ